VTTVELPTECVRCGQALLLRVEGRDVCERCRLGGSHLLTDGAAHASDAEEQEKPAERPPCTGCGRTRAEDGSYLVAVAIDGYCLSCRVQGLHLGG
jgi:hypothetical protein